MNIVQNAKFINAGGGTEIMVSETPERNFVKLRVANGQQWAVAMLSYEGMVALRDALYVMEIHREILSEGKDSKGDEF